MARRLLCGAGMDIQFKFMLPNGPNGPVVLIGGGADADGDGVLAAGEVSSLSASGANEWSRTQTIVAPSTGKLFALTFTVGLAVDYNFVIVDKATGAQLASGTGTTIFADDNWAGTLA